MSKKINPWNKKIVFLGDSITQNGLYIAYMNAYFSIHLPQLKPDFINLGVSSETASGLSEPEHPWPRPCVHQRIDRVLEETKPDIVIICYGINDGIYYPFSEERFEAYKNGILGLISKVRKAGAELVVMTPPPFNAKVLNQENLLPEGCEQYSYMSVYKDYNSVIGKYAEWVKTLHKEADKIIDLYSPLWWAIQNEDKDKPLYSFGDGIHPNEFGHWIIAKTILKDLFNISLQRVPDFIDPIHSEEWVKLVESEKEVIQKSNWKGYSRYDFYVNGREVILIEPNNVAPERPWIWRAEFFDAFSQADMAMVKEGWYLAYYRIEDMYGNPEAVELMKNFHNQLIKRFLLKEKTVLFGFSRGGLYSFNYTAAYPEKVSALYLDAPVLDIRSWPGGKGIGTGASREWEECKQIYDINEGNIESFKGNPLDKIKTVVEADIPIIMVAGDSDTAVPYSENGAVLVNLYKQLGGLIEEIVKPGCGHHPHSFDDPTPIVEFILRNTI